jgi:PAS domain S-box-containing protein
MTVTSSVLLDDSRLEIIYNAIPEAVIGIDSSSRRILHWNRAAERMFGRKSTNVAGQYADLIFPDPQFFERFFEKVAHESKQHPSWHTAWQFRRDDGATPRHFVADVTATCLRRAEGGEEYLMLIVRDSSHPDTARIEREEELRGSSGLQDIVMERTKWVRLREEIAIVANEAPTIDDALEVTLEKICSQTSLSCSDASPVIGHIYRKLTPALTTRLNYWRMTDPDRYESFRDASDAAEFQSGVGLIGRVLAGRRLEWVEDLGEDTTDPRSEAAKTVGLKTAFAFPVLAGQEMVGIMEVFSPEKIALDATLPDALGQIGVQLGRIFERKQVHETLRQQELLSAIGVTASKMAHAISNPLNGMYTATQLLEQVCKSQTTPVNEIIVSTLGDLKKEVHRLRSWLQEFRTVSRPMKFELEMADLSEIAREITAMEERRYTEQGVTVALEFPADLPKAKLDREKMKQALLNLCQNAVEAMPRGGKLTVRGYHSSDTVYLEVEDTGVGIPERMNIFEVFTSTKPGAAGLGLPVVQQIVSGHRGTIIGWNQPGKGTLFRVSFPL